MIDEDHWTLQLLVSPEIQQYSKLLAVKYWSITVELRRIIDYDWLTSYGLKLTIVFRLTLIISALKKKILYSWGKICRSR